MVPKLAFANSWVYGWVYEVLTIVNISLSISNIIVNMLIEILSIVSGRMDNSIHLIHSEGMFQFSSPWKHQKNVLKVS